MRLALVTLILVSLAIGCGSDGQDGDAFIAINWIGAPLYYNDSNPAIPADFYARVSYPAIVGTFSFVYEVWDQSTWEGSYTISVNPGEDGGFFPWSDGANGENKYFTLWLLASGPFVESSALVPPFEEENYSVSMLNAVQPRVLQKTELRLPLDSSRATAHLVQEIDLGTHHVRLECSKLESVSAPRP